VVLGGWAASWAWAKFEVNARERMSRVIFMGFRGSGRDKPGWSERPARDLLKLHEFRVADDPGMLHGGFEILGPEKSPRFSQIFQVEEDQHTSARAAAGLSELHLLRGVARTRTMW